MTGAATAGAGAGAGGRNAPHTPPCPDPRLPATLRAHIAHTMAFYHPRCIDPAGGCHHALLEDGTVADARTRHLVSSARHVYNYAAAWRREARVEYRDAAAHALAFVEQVHWQPRIRSYAWTLDWDAATRRARVTDGTRHAYGLAFVMLAQAHALQAGLGGAAAGLARTWSILEERFWEPAHGLYADEAGADDGVLRPYRGQNANMHACEAMLAAYDATGDRRYLDRAETLARSVTLRLAGACGGLIWEHYHRDWSVDWDYHRDDPRHLFRPWGYQSGHLTEWAKLLLILRRHGPQLEHGGLWQLPRAVELFEAAWRHAWDDRRGGLHYGFDPALRVCDSDKYFWVQAESFAAAGLLGIATGQALYWQRYDALWRHAWAHFIDHRHGAWWRVLDADNRPRGDRDGTAGRTPQPRQRGARVPLLKSPPGKTDYHTMGACHEMADALQALAPAARVATFGEALTDLVHEHGTHWRASPGGAPWNVARALARLQAAGDAGTPCGQPPRPAPQVAFGGAISRDVFGQGVWQASLDAGLDTRLMRRIERSPLLAVVRSTDPPRYAFIGDDSADLHYDPAALAPAHMQDLRLALFGGISLAREPLATRLLDLATTLAARGVTLAYDPNHRDPMDARYDAAFARMLALADLLKLSDDDVRALWRDDDLARGVQRLLQARPGSALLLTCGARGAWLFHRGRHWGARPPRVPVVDTVGAGDASLAAWLDGWLRLCGAADAPDLAWAQTLRQAVAAGAAACRHPGAHAPGADEVAALLPAVELHDAWPW